MKNKKDVLLGSSRVDIASLIIQKCLYSHIRDGGNAYFFAPLSLIFNEGANTYFRPSESKENVFCIKQIVDFKNNIVFPNIGTRNGFLHLEKSKIQNFPVPLQEIFDLNTSSKNWCTPAFNNSAWMKCNKNWESKYIPKLKVKKDQIPRQGINTGGLNKVFILEKDYADSIVNKEVDTFVNGYGELVHISTQSLFPLIHPGLFGRKNPKKQKYILCLHEKSGAPMNWEKITKLTGIPEYLEKYHQQMLQRKGIFIQSLMKNGFYWSLIGVGPYTFRKWKIVWESMGKRNFNAIIIDGRWQGNQAMHAYISSDSKTEAIRIQNALNENLPKYLQAFGMEGTCNWAQPGRIKTLISVDQVASSIPLFENTMTGCRPFDEVPGDSK